MTWQVLRLLHSLQLLPNRPLLLLALHNRPLLLSRPLLWLLLICPAALALCRRCRRRQQHAAHPALQGCEGQ